MATFVFPKGNKIVAYNAIIILPTTYFDNITGTKTGDDIEGERITQFSWQILGTPGTQVFEVSYDGGTTFIGVQVKNLNTGVTAVNMTVASVYSFNEHWPIGRFRITGAATNMTLIPSGKGF